jgi:hypothetical protein
MIYMYIYMYIYIYVYIYMYIYICIYAHFPAFSVAVSQLFQWYPHVQHVQLPPDPLGSTTKDCKLCDRRKLPRRFLAKVGVPLNIQKSKTVVWTKSVMVPKCNYPTDLIPKHCSVSRMPRGYLVWKLSCQTIPFLQINGGTFPTGKYCPNWCSSR